MTSHRFTLTSLLVLLVLALGATSAHAGTPKVTGDSDTNCVLSDAGAVSCWGENYMGVLGDGTAIPSRHTAAPVIGLSSGVLDLSVGNDFACALRSDRKVVCWGANDNGQLTPGTADDDPHPTPVEVAGIENVKAVVTAYSSVCVLLMDSTARCWGHNYYGQVGNGGVTGSGNHPVAQVAGLNNIVRIGSANFGFCALLADQTVSCWGMNWEGQLGREPSGMGNHSSTPTLVPGIAGAVDLVGGDAACVKLTDGSVKCWGDNAYFGLGDPTYLPGESSTPRTVPSLPAFSALLGTMDSKCVLALTGAYHCWGYNGHSQLLPGQTSIRPAAPVPFDGAIAIAEGGSSGSMCWIVKGGAVLCRGSNYYGEGGSPNIMNSNSPATVVPGADAVTASYAAGAASLKLAGKIKTDKSKKNYLVKADAVITPSALVSPATACVGALAGRATYTYTVKVRKNGKKKSVKRSKKWKATGNLAVTGATCTARLSFKLPVKTLNRKSVVLSATFAGNSELLATKLTAKKTKLPKLKKKTKK